MNEQEVQVSVVIPVYNAERYIRETLGYIQKQTVKAIEILCINDASTDASAQVLEKIAQSDPRIKIIENKENQGAGASRNIGLKNAKGAYICFLDADDIYESDLLEKELDVLKRNHADIAVVEAADFMDGKEIPKAENTGAQRMESCHSMRESSENLLLKWRWAPWNKMYRKAFIAEHKLEYQNIKAANDVFFYIMAFLLADKIVHVGSDRPLVYYRRGTGNTISSSRTPMDAYYAFEKVFDEMRERNIWDNYYENFYECFFSSMRSEWKNCRKEELAKESYVFLAEYGLERLGFWKLSPEQFKNKSVYLKILKIAEQKYESLWFLSFQEVLEKKYDSVAAKMTMANNKVIAVWGAAIRGKIFLQYCEKNGWDIFCVIDNDPCKWGRKLDKWEIQKFDDISEKVEIVIVLRNKYYNEIAMQISAINNKIEVINLEEVMFEAEGRRGNGTRHIGNNTCL